MSEAFLVGNNGIRFKRLTVPVPPDKTRYIVINDDETLIDMSGAKIAAEIGKTLVTLTPDNYSYSPVEAAPGVDKIIVSSRISGTTRTVDIPIDVVEPDPILDNNSWEVISYVSARGFASRIWSVGDVKTETINGVLHSFRIIGFDHDDLNESDPWAARADYNQQAYDAVTGKRYAGITFQSVEAMGTSVMNTGATTKGGWEECRMRTEKMPETYDSFPSDMQDVIRTVNKRTIKGGKLEYYDEVVVTSADKVFLPSVAEVTKNASYLDLISTPERNATSIYEAYDDNGVADILSKSETGEWLRSPHNMKICSQANHFVFISGNGIIDSGEPNSSSYNVYEFFPCFCV